MADRSPTDVMGKLRDRKLARLYSEASQHRAPNRRIPQPPDALVIGVSDRLGDSRLVELFIEAQFWAMPPDWCVIHFKRRYPPANVVFGGKCWERYQLYLDHGTRVPIKES